MRPEALPPTCVPDAAGSCSICGDEGRVGVVLAPARPTEARVRFESGVERVSLDLLESVRPGERVVVHMGFAIARLREHPAPEDRGPDDAAPEVPGPENGTPGSRRPEGGS